MVSLLAAVLAVLFLIWNIANYISQKYEIKRRTDDVVADTQAAPEELGAAVQAIIQDVSRNLTLTIFTLFIVSVLVILLPTLTFVTFDAKTTWQEVIVAALVLPLVLSLVLIRAYPRPGN